jgi:hypothetical protein
MERGVEARDLRQPGVSNRNGLDRGDRGREVQRREEHGLAQRLEQVLVDAGVGKVVRTTMHDPMTGGRGSGKRMRLELIERGAQRGVVVGERITVDLDARKLTFPATVCLEQTALQR